MIYEYDKQIRTPKGEPIITAAASYTLPKEMLLHLLNVAFEAGRENRAAELRLLLHL